MRCGVVSIVMILIMAVFFILESEQMRLLWNMHKVSDILGVVQETNKGD